MMGFNVDDEAADRRRLRQLFDEHRDAVLGYALRRTDERADAADVVAETFLVAWRRLDDVPASDARPWLLGVARKVLANHRRGDARRHRLAERLAADVQARLPAPSADGEHEHVREALARLSPDDREVLLLAAWEELTPTQIGKALGLRAVTVRSRLHRARRRLRAELQEDDARPQVQLSYAKEEAR